MTETQQRFLKAISERITSGEVEEIRLYPTVRAGHLESGVAIVAVRDLATGNDSSGGDAATATTQPATLEPTEATPAEVASGTEVAVEAALVERPDGAGIESVDEAVVVDESRVARSDRLSILTAHFRQQVKGPERGKWEFDMVHDADAPLETIERVVRGVAHRAGEDGEPELLTGDEFRRALTEPWWTAQT